MECFWVIAGFCFLPRSSITNSSFSTTLASVSTTSFPGQGMESVNTKSPFSCLESQAVVAAAMEAIQKFVLFGSISLLLASEK